MNILVFGYGGQLARELRRLPGITALGRDQADLSHPESCAAAIRARRPDAVINAAAYTHVDRAEEEEDIATRVNGEAPGVMARACADLGIPLVHVSTDYVFDDMSDLARGETAAVGPLGAYGRSKLVGEEAIRAAGGRHAILRTSWVFSAHGANFVKTMLRLSDTRDRLTVVADQVGGPTPARALAAACVEVARQLVASAQKTGTYHFAGTPDVSWADFARAIFATAKRKVQVQDIPSSEYPTPARRPRNSRLDCSLITAVFGVERPDWRAGLAEVLEDLKETDCDKA